MRVQRPGGKVLRSFAAGLRPTMAQNVDFAFLVWFLRHGQLRTGPAAG